MKAITNSATEAYEKGLERTGTIVPWLEIAEMTLNSKIIHVSSLKFFTPRTGEFSDNFFICVHLLSRMSWLKLRRAISDEKVLIARWIRKNRSWVRQKRSDCFLAQHRWSGSLRHEIISILLVILSNTTRRPAIKIFQTHLKTAKDMSLSRGIPTTEVLPCLTKAFMILPNHVGKHLYPDNARQLFSCDILYFVSLLTNKVVFVVYFPVSKPSRSVNLTALKTYLCCDRKPSPTLH